MTQHVTFQQVGSTLPSPRKHVVGVLSSLQEAEQAVQALVEAGYQVEDMALIQSHDFPAALQERWRKGGRVGQMLYQLEVTTDEGSLVELLEAAARPESAILSLYMPHRQHLAAVSALLFNHGARLVKYVGTWSVEDLFPPLQEEHVSAQVSRGVGNEPESESQSSASIRPQDRESKQALRNTAAVVARLYPQPANTAQDLGQPGVAAPPLGHDSGSAYAPIMDTSDLEGDNEHW